jgi:rhodanese-related sulfurtransferase
MRRLTAPVSQLNGDDFRYLIQPSLARPLERDAAIRLVNHGAQWIDVRMPQDVHGQRIQGALSIPHPFIRSKLVRADPARTYIVVCATLQDAPAIAFALCKAGFDAYYLKGGYAEMPAESLVRTGT